MESGINCKYADFILHVKLLIVQDLTICSYLPQISVWFTFEIRAVELSHKGRSQHTAPPLSICVMTKICISRRKIWAVSIKLAWHVTDKEMVWLSQE